METQVNQQNNGQGFGIAALVLGILAAVISFIPCVGVVALLIGIVAIVFGAVSLAKASMYSAPKGLGIAGVSLGSLALLVAIFWILFIVKLGDHSEIEDKFRNFMEWTEDFNDNVDSSVEEVQSLDDLEKALDELLTVGGREYRITAVSMGNPHAVIFVDTYDTLDLETEGRAIETHARFPQKTNVEFIQVLSRTELNMKVWERGAGVTLACGTGACAVLVAAHLTGRTEDRALIHLPGGDLDIHWDKATNHVFKTGPANLVFEGRVKI